MQDIWVRFLGREDPREKETATDSSYSYIVLYSPWGIKESDTAEQVTHTKILKTE